MRIEQAILVAAAFATCLPAQVRLDPKTSFKVNLPAGGPVALAGADWDASKAVVRGGALQLDLRSNLQLRNTGNRRICAVSLLVLAQEVTPGGKASVTVPSLDIAPGDQFPVRLDLSLIRPLSSAVPDGVPLVEVSLDGVLFEDLTYSGPDRLKARRGMIAWELAARRDRKALLAALDANGPEALRRQMLAVLSKPAPPAAAVAFARSTPATAVQEQQVQLTFLNPANAPVELLSGTIRIAGADARTPRVELVNRAKKAISFLEIAWLARDGAGEEMPAGALPAELTLPPGQGGMLSRDAALRFSKPVTALSGYVSSVEFADGSFWIPPAGEPGVPASGEIRRLAELYRRRGLDAVIQQLKLQR